MNDRTEPGVCPACRGTKMMDGGGGSRIPCDLLDEYQALPEPEMKRQPASPTGLVWWYDARVLRRDAVIRLLAKALHRYRHETPLGSQPHMIAGDVDALLTAVERDFH